MERLCELSSIPYDEILKAREVAPENIKNTPLIKLNTLLNSNKEIFLKLENLQEVGSFKVRGAYNALHNSDQSLLRKHGVYTSSAGNFAQGLAWASSLLNIPCTLICPVNTPQVKLDSIIQHKGYIVKVPYNEWWGTMLAGQHKDFNGVFIHPCCDRNVMAGNGVIGIEIVEQLPDVDTIICSYGGGGHSLGIASALKHLKEDTKIYACEAETSAPLYESLKAGKAVEVANFQKSFVDGMNGKSMFPCMWNLASNLITDSIVMPLPQICDAIKLLLTKNHIVAEGAGGATVAAALTNKIPDGKIVCVISGGNIDLDKIKLILDDIVPR